MHRSTGSREPGRPPLSRRAFLGRAAASSALLAAPRIPSVRLVATLAAPADPTRLAPPLANAREQARREGVGRFETAGRTLELHHEFFDDLERTAASPPVGLAGQAWMLFHSPTDMIVPFRDAEQLLARSPGPCSLVSLPGAGHLLADRADGEFVAAVIAAWADRFLPGQ